VHFHLYNVQVINRIGWDGTVKPPYANELGWKETVKMHPLEDIVVAIRAKKPALPGFGLPLSVRPMDPSQMLGVPTGFTQVNVLTGLPATVVNASVNYGWEYVWHCHILGHEENDFMRPVKFNANEAVPAAPTLLAMNRATGLLTWFDNATTEYQYTVEAKRNAASNYTLVATGLANATQQAGVPIVNASGQPYYLYRVTAVGASGSASTVLDQTPIPPPAAPSNLQASPVNNPVHSVNLQWRDNATNETGFIVNYRRQGTTGWTAYVPNVPARAGSGGGVNVTITLPITSGGNFQFQVIATGAGGNSAPSNNSLANLN
jgi:hypothetical protein